MNLEEMKNRHSAIKEITSILANTDSEGKFNPFKLLELQIDVMDKIHDLTNIDETTSEKDLLKRYNTLLKVADVLNKEGTNEKEN